MSNNALFQPIKMGGNIIKNRVVMSGMTTNYATMEGGVSRKLYNHIVERARGGVGLIVLEAAGVSWPEGKSCVRQLKINDAAITADLHDLADSVHAFGAKIIVQLHHGGFMAIPPLADGKQPICASPFGDAREMTLEEIKRVQQDFINAAVNAKVGGLDGVQIHAAAMYLVNSFISPACNTRTDEYGGSMENRFRFLKEIIEGIRAACPRPFILGIRLGAMDFFPGGLTLEEGVQYAKWCEEAGVDFIDVTTGFFGGNEAMETQWDPEGARVFMGEAVKKAVSVPVSIVGKLRTPSYCAEIIEEGKTDMVTIGRQMICDPQWANKAMRGRDDLIRPCLNCSQGCAEQAFFQGGNIHCQINPYAGFDDLYSEYSVPAAGVKKNIAVVGGGVAGMQFAIIAQKRGHNVTIYEKSDKLGGQMNIACVPPHKSDLAKALEWFKAETLRQGAEVKLNTEVTAEELIQMAPDAVVMAVGSVPSVPPIKGIETAIESWDILDGTVEPPVGKKVAIIGGGVVGAEVGHLLCENGCDVTIIEMMDEICIGHQLSHRMLLIGYLAEHAHVNTGSKVTEIGEGYICYTDAAGQVHKVDVDCSVIAAGHTSVGSDMLNALNAAGIETAMIGDCVNVSNIRNATRAALDLAYRI